MEGEDWLSEGQSYEMNIDYCKEFLELVNCLNYTKAAKNLNLHQSTLSKHVQSMEKELGTKLIRANGSGPKLTETGYAFVGYANKICSTYNQAVSEINFLSSATPLRADWQLYDQSLISIISAALILNDQKGNIPVVHHEASSRDLCRHVAEGTLDVALVTTLPEFIDEAGLEGTLLTSSPLTAVVESTNKLAERESIHFADLKNETFIHLLHEVARPGWSTLERLCQRYGFTPHTRDILVSSHPEQLAIPLHGCVFIYASREREMKMLSKLHGFACLPIVDKDASFDVYAVYRSDNAEHVAGFLHALQQAQELITE